MNLLIASIKLKLGHKRAYFCRQRLHRDAYATIDAKGSEVRNEDPRQHHWASRPRIGRGMIIGWYIPLIHAYWMFRRDRFHRDVPRLIRWSVCGMQESCDKYYFYHDDELIHDRNCQSCLLFRNFEMNEFNNSNNQHSYNVILSIW